MILESVHNVATNLKDSVEFSVSDDSSKIFAFLSNFLYRDKERSVITELSSNALDAHKMIGRDDLPISVTLPTSLVPMFTVRDFGPGLSEANVYLFLTKYGSSSKGGSNDFIGGFGIGSKSPAAVSDTWNIKSYHDGMETEYLIHINDKGIPNINKLYSKHTTETGLEVSIPTKGITVWHDAARVAYAHYEVMPQIKGNSSAFSSVKFDSTFHNLVKFSTKANTRSYGSSGYPYILMNRRAYQIDTSKISGCSKMFNGYADWYLPFDTSSLSVSLSREDLQYDSRTIDNVNARIKDIEARFKSDWLTTVSIETSLFEYQRIANEFKEKNHLSGSFCKTIAVANGDKFVSNVDYDNLHRFSITFDKSNLNVNFASNDVVKTLKCGRIGIGSPNVSYSKISYSDDTKRMLFNSKTKGDVVFVLRDATNTPSRVKNAIATGIIPNGIILDKQWFDLVPEAFTKVLASSLDKVVITRIKREKVAAETFILSGRQLVRWAVPDTSERVYITIKNAKTVDSIIYDFDSKFVSTFKNILANTIIFIKEGTDVPAHGISAKTWTERKYSEIVLKRNDIVDAVNWKYYRDMSDYYCIGKVLKSPTLFASFNSNTVIAKIHADFALLKDKKIDLQIINLCDTMNSCERLLGKVSTTIAADDVYTKLKLAYPMMKLLGDRCINNDISDVVEYMRLCGK